MSRFRITSVDYAPDDLYEQVPFDGVLLRKIAGPDRPDYWLAELSEPLKWSHDGEFRVITHLVLASRYVGQTITPDFGRLIIGISFVTDQSVLDDELLNFDKCFYSAIGVAEKLDAE
jgi:hypothetical protein